MKICDECLARCCKKSGLGFQYIWLYPGEASYERFKPFVARLPDGSYILPFNKGVCRFLKDNRCSIYKERPESCRDYTCWNPLYRDQNRMNQKHVELMKKYKQ